MSRRNASKIVSTTTERPRSCRHGYEVLQRWDDYSKARDDMFTATDTAWAPWFVARSDDKRRARLNVIEHLLSSVPYKVCRARR